MKIAAHHVREDIAYFSKLLNDLDRDGFNAEPADMLDYYAPFLERRRQLLAAVEAGRPDAWREFTA